MCVVPMSVTFAITRWALALGKLAGFVLAATISACATSAEPADTTAAEVVAAVRYPVVLAHGFSGFEDFAGLDFATYFYGVKDHLARQGETVFTPAVDPFNDSVTRGEELLTHVEEILAQTGARKVNLVGHSQGGLDARYVAHVRPDLVASVTTIGTPHGGSKLADIVLGVPGSGVVAGLVDALVRLAGRPLWDQVGNETSVGKAFQQLTVASCADFNRTYTDAPDVPYFSIAGRSSFSLGGDECASDDPPEFIARYASSRDRTSTLLLVPAAVLSGISLAPNDGLVRVESARHGTFLGCIPADHLDEIGQPHGGSPGLGTRFDHLAFYADLVAYLRARGL